MKKRWDMAENNLLKDGINLYKHGKYAEALTYLLSLPDNSGIDTVELAYYLGLCYSKMKRYDDALLYLEQVVTSSHKDLNNENSERVLQCRYLLAVIYCISGRKKLADFELNKLLDIGYKTSSVYASLAFVAWEQGNVELCTTYYEMSLEDDENNPTALNGLGYVLACEGTDLARALSYCKKASDIIPDSAAFLDSLGWVYYKMGLFKESVKYLKMALKYDKKNPVIAGHLQEVQKIDE